MAKFEFDESRENDRAYSGFEIRCGDMQVQEFFDSYMSAKMRAYELVENGANSVVIGEHYKGLRGYIPCDVYGCGRWF